MKRCIVLAAAVSALILAGGAFVGAFPSRGPAPPSHLVIARPPAEAAKCAALEKRFDLSIAPHAAAPNAMAARALRQDGGALCTDGRAEDGTQELEQALIDIDVPSTF